MPISSKILVEVFLAQNHDFVLGFGFVIYDSVDSASAAIANYNTNMIDDKWVEKTIRKCFMVFRDILNCKP